MKRWMGLDLTRQSKLPTGFSVPFLSLTYLSLRVPGKGAPCKSSPHCCGIKSCLCLFVCLFLAFSCVSSPKSNHFKKKKKLTVVAIWIQKSSMRHRPEVTQCISLLLLGLGCLTLAPATNGVSTGQSGQFCFSLLAVYESVPLV